MEFEKSSIERLKRSLYSRDESRVPQEKRTPVRGTESEVPTSWGEPPSFALSPDALDSNDMRTKNNSFFNKFFIFSIIFFVLALGLAFFIFFGGLNMISSNNVDIKITAPSSISSGEELDLGLSVVNQNRTDLNNVSLFVSYPDGVRSPAPDNAPLINQKIDIGTVSQGSKKDETVRAVLFGEKGKVKTITLNLEYTVKGSNATFSKQKTYDVTIDSSPLLLNVSYPKEVNSGQTVVLSVDVTSNSSVPVQNAEVKIEYPYGFTYASSNIKPLRGNNIWNLGDLQNGDKKTLTLQGVMVGQNMEDRSFRISLGTPSADTSQDFGVTLAVSQVTVGIRKSFFDLSVAAGEGNIATAGAPFPVTISWQNTLPETILNSHIEATLSGNAFNRSSVSVGNSGFYRSTDDTVTWDKNSLPDLAAISPGATGQVVFSLGTFGSPQINTIKNPHIDMHIVVTGDKSGTDSSPVSSSQDVTVKIPSTLLLVSKSHRNSGPFANTGPVPPRADIQSTYTVTWTLTNTTNDLSNAVVSATLPSGVVWKGQVSPSNEQVTFDPDTHKVLWSPGTISAGTGFTYSPRNVSFQLGITPSLTQVGTIANLTGDTQTQAMDTYTATTLNVVVPPVTTQYFDSDYKSGDETVAR